MKPKTTKALYWIVTLLFALFFIGDGIAMAVQVQQAKDIMKHLGYPLYVLTII